MTKKTVNGWAIAGDCGLYTGWWLTKQDAIEAHCKAFAWFGETDDIKTEWAKRQKDGDQVVKVKITYDNNKRRK